MQITVRCEFCPSQADGQEAAALPGEQGHEAPCMLPIEPTTII